MASPIATEIILLSFLLSCLCNETAIVKNIANSTDSERSTSITGEWIPFRGKEYLLVMDAGRRQDLNRNDAMQKCLEHGAVLVAVEAEEEFEFLKREIRRRVTTIGQEFSHEQWWTAGRVQNDVWVWDKGNRPQVMVSALKRKHIPKGDEHNFLALSHGHEQQGWRLRSVPGNYKLRYICEKERYLCDDEGSLERHLQYFLYKASGHQPLQQQQQQHQQQHVQSSEDAGHRLKPIRVSITVEAILITKLDEELSSLCTNIKLTVDWTDKQLQWNETQFSNISSITLSSQKLWTPQIVIFNSASGQDKLGMGSVVVTSSGRAHTKVTDDDLCIGCQRDALFFPFDRFFCLVQLGSRSTAAHLRLRSTVPEPSVGWLSYSSPWKLDKSSQSYRINCSLAHTGDDGFRHSTSGCVQLEFYLLRPLLYYVVVLLVPVLLLTMPLLALLFVSSAYHLKTPAMLVLVLLFFLVLHFICTLTPSGSTVIPIIAVYPICLMFISATSACISLISSRYRQDGANASLPSCCQRRPVKTKSTEEEKWLSSAQKTDLCSCTSIDLTAKTSSSATNEYRLQNRKSISWLDEKTPETVETFLDGPEFPSAELVFNTETTTEKQWKTRSACGLVPPCPWNSSVRDETQEERNEVRRNEQLANCDRPVEHSMEKSDCCVDWRILSGERKLDLVLFSIAVLLLVGYSSWIIRCSLSSWSLV